MSSMRFLCFGDSLTEGFVTHVVKHPYSKRLRELLSERCKGPVEVDTMGVSGEVIDTMVNRLDMTLTDAKSSYNWIIILGGTNDLGDSVDADKLMAALCQMHNRARATGARTVVLTIPQIAEELNTLNLPYWPQMPSCESLRTRKAKVNEGLREYCATSGGQSICVDLFNDLPCTTLSPEEQSKYWSDGVHCTPQGYDRMAEIIFAALEEYL